MNIRHNEQLRERLAAEYVLGTLRGGARRRFEGWLSGDAALRRAVAEWQDRLLPLAEMAPAAAPPQSVWAKIERELDRSAPVSGESLWQRLAKSLEFWRRMAVTSTAVAMLLVALIVTRQFSDVDMGTSYIAALSDERGQVTMLVKAEPASKQLAITVVAAQELAADKSLELWALPKDGPPRSLGLVPANGLVTLPLPADATPASVPTLAISLEPKGGSPNPHAPTGPVLFKGAWVQV